MSPLNSAIFQMFWHKTCRVLDSCCIADFPTTANTDTRLAAVEAVSAGDCVHFLSSGYHNIGLQHRRLWTASKLSHEWWPEAGQAALLARLQEPGWLLRLATAGAVSRREAWWRTRTHPRSNRLSLTRPTLPSLQKGALARLLRIATDQPNVVFADIPVIYLAGSLWIVSVFCFFFLFTFPLGSYLLHKKICWGIKCINSWTCNCR